MNTDDKRRIAHMLLALIVIVALEATVVTWVIF
jgi:hypothetical protein